MADPIYENGVRVLCYTRLPQDEQIYAPKLAYSMHLAYCEEGQGYRSLNHNSGVLFAKAVVNKDGTLSAKSLKKPYLFYLADGTFGVVAVRTDPEGDPDEDSRGAVLLFTSPDLIHFEEVGLLNLKEDAIVQDVMCEYDGVSKMYLIRWSDTNGNFYLNASYDLMNLNGASPPEIANAFSSIFLNADIEGIVPGNEILVTRAISDRLLRKLTVPLNVRNVVQERIVASTEDELKKVHATAIYSDGTSTVKKVDWHSEGIDWNRPGNYPITGRIHQERYPFPLVVNRADPCITKWRGKYYFIATNDADGNRTLSIREAETIQELFKAEETKLLDTETYDHLRNFLWAPELHAIGDDLYIFHAGSTGEFVDIQSHTMRLKRGGNPVKAEDWEAPVRVVLRDGRNLFEAGITLDMTVIQWNDRVYVVWAQRQFTPKDLGSWIYIAEADPAEPWKLKSDPVLLSRPEYGWENNRTFVDEGPFALITENKIFVTIACALVDATYCVGLLSADLHADLLDAASWTKGNYPILTSRSVPGEYGPGHNSYVTDENGVIWNVYHARAGIDQPRSVGVRRVHFDVDGYPVLDLTEERDLNTDLADVSIEVILRDK